MKNVNSPIPEASFSIDQVSRCFVYFKELGLSIVEAFYKGLWSASRNKTKAGWTPIGKI